METACPSYSLRNTQVQLKAGISWFVRYHTLIRSINMCTVAPGPRLPIILGCQAT